MSTSDYTAQFPWHLFQPQPWMQHAACRGLDTNIFFPERGDDYRPAKKICAECPVKQECYEYSFTIPQVSGIWGGITGKDRRQTKRNRTFSEQPTGSKPIRHGTNSGYNVHRKRGEEACEECKDAHKRYVETQREKTR